MQNILKYISEHKIVSLAAYFAVFLMLVIGFVKITDDVFENESLWIDKAILNAVHGYSSAFLDSFFIFITQFGGVLGIIAITAVILSFLIYRRKYKNALIVGLTVAGAALLNVILKLIFERTRPDLWQQLVVETSFSFPSGHAMLSSALALSVIFICWKTRYRWLMVVLGSLFIVVIGFSRLYLGVHYPTDILAGWVVSAAWLTIVGIIVGSKYLSKISKK